jgi:Helix-turn-helix
VGATTQMTRGVAGSRVAEIPDSATDADAPTSTTTKLRFRILESGMQQGEIARKCGFPAPRLSEYVMGRRTIPPHHLVLLCEVLRANPDDIIGVEIG